MLEAIEGEFARYKAPPEGALAQVDDAHRDRLRSIELAVDAIAVEVERIAEAQRFSTKLLAERPESAPRPENALRRTQ